LPETTLRQLAALEEEADKFWRGDRAQADLFDGPVAHGVEITEPYQPAEGVTATVSVNGGPAVDLDDIAAVHEALTPLFEELAEKAAGKAVHP
jgi:hypothetical protein